jgi:hypothetical protein
MMNFQLLGLFLSRSNASSKSTPELMVRLAITVNNSSMIMQELRSAIITLKATVCHDHPMIQDVKSAESLLDMTPAAAYCEE